MFIILICLIKRLFYNLLSLYMKNAWMQLGWFELWSKNRDVILIRAKDYFENDKERLRRQARDKYRNLFEEEKNKKREYGKNR